MIVGIDARPALFGRTGFGRVVRETLVALRRRGRCELRPFGVAWRRVDPGLDPVPGVVRHRVPARLHRLLGLDAETWLGALDVFHHTDLVYPAVRHAAEVVSLHDVSFLHGEPWHDGAFRRRVEPRVRRTAARAAAVLVPCERVARDVVARGVCPAERVTVVPLGLDHMPAEPRPEDPHRVRGLLMAAGVDVREHERLVLLPGTREPRKNQLAVVRAFLDAAPRDARLVLVGSRGWGCPDLERMLEWPDVRRRVTTLGAVDDADLGALMRRADLVVYPSFVEGFGLPAGEAMRCGRAVLTAVETPMADYGGDAVVTVDPRSLRALGRQMVRLLGDDGLRAELGAAARRRVEGFTWERTAEALERVYQRAADSR